MGRERRKFVTRKASVDLHSGKGNACAKKRTRKCATFPTKKISFLLSPPPSREGRARRNNNAHISHVWHVHITIFFSSPVLFFSTHTHTHTHINFYHVSLFLPPPPRATLLRFLWPGPRTLAFPTFGQKKSEPPQKSLIFFFLHACLETKWGGVTSKKSSFIFLLFP